MIISNSKMISDLADAIVSRTYEVYAYDMNISNYEKMIATFNVEISDEVKALSEFSYQEAIANCPEDKIEEFANLNHYNHIKYLIKTEVIERTKTNNILEMLVSSLKDITTDEEYDAAITAAVERRG